MHSLLDVFDKCSLPFRLFMNCNYEPLSAIDKTADQYVQRDNFIILLIRYRFVSLCPHKGALLSKLCSKEALSIMVKLFLHFLHFWCHIKQSLLTKLISLDLAFDSDYWKIIVYIIFLYLLKKWISIHDLNLYVCISTFN